MEKIQTHIDAMSHHFGIVTTSGTYIDWSKYQNGATVVVGGEYPGEYSFVRGEGHGNRAPYILGLQQDLEYLDGDPCHIVWE